MGGTGDRPLGPPGGPASVGKSGPCRGQTRTTAEAGDSGAGSQKTPTRPAARRTVQGQVSWCSGYLAAYFPNYGHCGWMRQPGSARGQNSPPRHGDPSGLPSLDSGTQRGCPMNLPRASAPGQECGKGEGP